MKLHFKPPLIRFHFQFEKGIVVTSDLWVYQVKANNNVFTHMMYPTAVHGVVLNNSNILRFPYSHSVTKEEWFSMYETVFQPKDINQLFNYFLKHAGTKERSDNGGMADKPTP